jgi:hypothetical protein
MEILISTESVDPNQVVGRILERLVELRGNRPQDDDATLMLAELTPEAKSEGAHLTEIVQTDKRDGRTV